MPASRAFASSTSGLKEKLRDRIRAMRRARYDNPSLNAVLSSPPTLSMANVNPSATFPKQYNIISGGVVTPGVFRIAGSPTPIVYSTKYALFPCVSCISGGNINGTSNQITARIAFMVYATDFAVELLSTPLKYRMIVDGRYESVAGFTCNEAGGTTWLTVTFATAAARRIEIEVPLNGAFASIRTRTADGAWPIGDDGFRLVVMGDSFTAATGATLSGQGYARVMGDCLGIFDTVCSGAGGTGYDTQTATNYKLANRIATDLVAAAPNLSVWALGINDPDTATVSSAVTANLATFRASFPTTPLVVLGSWAPATGPNATMLAVEARIKAAVEAYNDPFIKFVANSNDAAGAWCYNGTPCSDGTHPTDASHMRLGGRAADGVLGALELMAA